MTTEEQNLLNKLEQKTKESNYLTTYLKSGISDENQPLYEYLKKDVFENKFYVPKNKSQQDEDEKLISALFKDPECGVLVFRAHGGSGKTTYIKMLEKIISKDYECLHINLASTSTNLESARKVSQIIFHKARKYLNTMFDHDQTEAYFRAFEKSSLDILKFMKNNEYYEASTKWEEIVNVITKPEHKEVADQIQKIMRSLVFEEIKEKLANSDVLLMIQMSCLFLVNLLLANPIQDRFLVVFDNIEAINFSHNSTLPNIIIDTFYFLSKIYNALDIDFSSKVNFLISIRTTTKICLDKDHYEGFWGTFGEYIHDVDYEDFCAEALLKKLKFLYHTKLQNSVFYEELYLLCSILCDKDEIDEYLSKNKDISNTDYKYFIRETLAPFFGNNFRLVVFHVAKIIALPQIKSRISKLIEDKDKLGESINDNDKEKKFKDDVINGARGVLMFQLFKNFSEQNIFSYFGIENISGDATHSMTRVLLSFLYWDMYKHLSNNRNYEGTSLLKIVDIFYNVYDKEKMCAFIDLIYKLSPYSTELTSDGKTVAISKWSYMILMNNALFSNVDIDIIGIKEAVEKYPQEDSKIKLKSIKITLSDTAFCFREFVSNHFEFLNARNEEVKNSLFMYEKENYSEDEYVFQFVISQNIKTLSKYIDGMIDEVIEKCHYKKDNDKECSYCDLEECIKKPRVNSSIYNNIFSCSLYIRYIEVSEAVINAIDYVDRYRRYLWVKYKDVDINEKILDLLKEYGFLLKNINSKVKKYKKFDKITSKIRENFRNENIDSFHAPRSAYYYNEKDGIYDFLFDAIENLKLPETDKLQDIYKVCETIKKNKVNN